MIPQRRHLILSSTLASLMVACSAVNAQACALCFGALGKDMSRGFFWGVIILLLLPFMLIGVLVSAIVRATKKNRPS